MTDGKPKQLILLLDGTWDDADIGPCDSNIVRLREIINRSLGEKPVKTEPGKFAGSRVYDHSDIQRLVFYARGVGTGALRDRILGGAFGEGLEQNVRRAYRFLSWNYETGDAIFIFGFSRGAYTARSLVGLLACSGLLKRSSCDAERESRAWSLYRTPVEDRLAADFDALTDDVHERASFKITCVGVFDTVGALGIPLPIFWRANRDRYGFHNVELGSITETSFQALAIDEHREPFQPAPWRRPKFVAFSKDMTIEQVWFPGAHGDVGGGYTEERNRWVKVGTSWQRNRSLDDLTLDWMLKRVLGKYDNFPVRLDERGWTGISEDWWQAGHHESRNGPYLLRPFVYRPINNYAGQTAPWPRHMPFFVEDRFVGYDRHAEPLRERVHVSALRRYGETVQLDGRDHVYAPQNLRAVLPYIGRTYSLEGSEKVQLIRKLRVVGWNGEALDPERDKATIWKLFQRPRIAADFKARVAEVVDHTPPFGAAAAMEPSHRGPQDPPKPDE
jgi:hypothetical protein